MSSEYCVFFEGRWVKPEWIDTTPAEAPDFNPEGYVPVKIEGHLRLFPKSHVQEIVPAASPTASLGEKG